MRVYKVQPGDSPGSIAAEFAGCPRCSRDLLAANVHKPIVSLPNGYRTFRGLRAGEKLNLPDKWFSKEFDELPPKYFAALPHPDGVTPSSLGDRVAAGVLGDYATLDQATMLVGTLPSMDNQSFSNAVPDAAAMIDSSVQEADASSNQSAIARATDAHNQTYQARSQNNALQMAITAGDQTAQTQARLGVQNALSSALASARIALQSVYGNTTPTPAPSTGLPPAVVAAAQAAAAAISADPNYCTAVAQSGSAVNAAVHALKTAWNAANPSAPVPINTGNYEQATATVLTQVLGSAPAACPPRAAPTPAPVLPSVLPPSTPIAVTSPQSSGLSTGAIVGSLLGIGAVGGAIYLTMHPPKQRRIRRVPGERRS